MTTATVAPPPEYTRGPAAGALAARCLARGSQCLFVLDAEGRRRPLAAAKSSNALVLSMLIPQLDNDLAMCIRGICYRQAGLNVEEQSHVQCTGSGEGSAQCALGSR